MSKFVKSAGILFYIFFFTFTAYALEVIPSGECIGVKMYTDGLIVVNTSELKDKNGKIRNIAHEYGIKKGDIIKKINGREAISSHTLADTVASSGGKELTLTIENDNKATEKKVKPIRTDEGYKLGIWLRDSTAGLGTITFFTQNSFAALGHGICDIDTGNIMPIHRGIIQDCTINSIVKGSNGSPGAITGNIDGSEKGKITKNTEKGIFGTLSSPPIGKAMPVADKKEVKTGDAVILADVDGNGVQEYSIEIKRIFPPMSDTKDMVIKITDSSLIEKTGGIVQGMSGSPIIQNGKLVGAVTHVFVNDPTRGYGIFIENMLAEAEKIK